MKSIAAAASVRLVLRARSNKKRSSGALGSAAENGLHFSAGLEHRTMGHARNQVAGTRSEAIPQAGLTHPSTYEPLACPQ